MDQHPGIFTEATGELEKLVSAFDWSRTPLGPRSSWPPCLRITVVTLLESSLPIVLLWGRAGTMIYNDAYSLFAGQRHPGSLGAPVREAWPELADFNSQVIETSLAGRKLVYRNQPLVVRRSGADEQIWLDLDYTPVRDDQGIPAGVLVSVIETTAKVRAEQALAIADERMRLALDAGAIVGTWIWNIPDDIVRADARFARFFGLDPDRAAEGLPIQSFMPSIHMDDRPRVTAEIENTLGKGGPFRCEYRVRQPDGSYKWIEANGYCERDSEDRPARFPGLITDISARKATDAALARQEEQYRIAFEASGVLGAWRYDIAERRFTADPHFARLYDLDERELSDGLSFEKFLDSVVPEDRQRIRGAIRTALVMRSEFFEEYRITGNDGRVRWVLARGKAYPEEGDLLYATGIAVDITKRKEAELNLAVMNKTLEQRVADRTRERDRIWLTSQDLFVVCGVDGVYVSANPAWSDQLGYNPADLAGASFGDFVHPEDKPAMEAGFNRIRSGNTARDIDIRMRKQSGDYIWYAWTCIPEGDQFYAMGRNIHARMALEEQLRQAQKMEAVGQLTGGIAHDFNNLLAGITGSLELMKLRIAQGRNGEIPRYLDAATSSAARAAALTHRLLAFSRRQTLDPKPVGLNRLVISMEDLVRRTVGPGIVTEIVTAGGLWTTLCDANQIENALLNLAINARDAMPDGGRLTIETSNTRLDDAYAASQGGEVKPGQYVALCVSDTGSGMPPDVIARAFDPFFTTKPLGQGTGLGLSMIYGFVKQSGGHVRIYSEIGQGTSVKLYLPRHAGEAETDMPEHDLGESPRAETARTVLVVDDEPVVRMLILDVLDELGYGAVEAGDGPSGLKALQTSQKIDLLITDVGLPGGMNGRQLADAARLLKPDLRVLFITGYAENAAVGNGRMDVGMEVMSKPFAMDALASKLNGMLSG